MKSRLHQPALARVEVAIADEHTVAEAYFEPDVKIGRERKAFVVRNQNILDVGRVTEQEAMERAAKKQCDITIGARDVREIRERVALEVKQVPAERFGWRSGRQAQRHRGHKSP